MCIVLTGMPHSRVRTSLFVFFLLVGFMMSRRLRRGGKTNRSMGMAEGFVVRSWMTWRGRFSLFFAFGLCCWAFSLSVGAS